MTATTTTARAVGHRLAMIAVLEACKVTIVVSQVPGVMLVPDTTPCPLVCARHVVRSVCVLNAVTECNALVRLATSFSAIIEAYPRLNDAGSIVTEESVRVVFPLRALTAIRCLEGSSDNGSESKQAE